MSEVKKYIKILRPCMSRIYTVQYRACLNRELDAGYIIYTT